VSVAKSENNRFHGDGVLVDKEGSVIEPDGYLRNKGSAFVTRCYISVPIYAVAFFCSWDNKMSSVCCAEVIFQNRPVEITQLQVSALKKIETERGLRPGVLVGVRASAEEVMSSTPLDALVAKYKK
jgi:hypothetical protein